MGPEKAPAILWGQGVPTANAPFTMVQKGSLHMVVNATDNATALYIAPLNALVNDQYKNFVEFRDELGIDSEINKYIGTMSGDEKKAVRS